MIVIELARYTVLPIWREILKLAVQCNNWIEARYERGTFVRRRELFWRRICKTEAVKTLWYIYDIICQYKILLILVRELGGHWRPLPTASSFVFVVYVPKQMRSCPKPFVLLKIPAPLFVFMYHLLDTAVCMWYIPRLVPQCWAAPSQTRQAS